jgi:hypothetical protein
MTACRVLAAMMFFGAGASKAMSTSSPFSYERAIADAVQVDRRPERLLKHCELALDSVYRERREELFSHWQKYLTKPGSVLLEIVGSTAPLYAFTFVKQGSTPRNEGRYISNAAQSTLRQIASIRPASIRLSKSLDAADAPCYFLTYVDDRGTPKQFATYWLPPADSSLGKLLRILQPLRTKLDPPDE